MGTVFDAASQCSWVDDIEEPREQTRAAQDTPRELSLSTEEVDTAQSAVSQSTALDSAGPDTAPPACDVAMTVSSVTGKGSKIA